MGIYLDNNATTEPCPEAAAAAQHWLRVGFANPSAQYDAARAAAAAVADARRQVAETFGCDPIEVVFTSGGSESIVTAIRSAAATAPEGRNRMITTTVEHPCSLDSARMLKDSGFEVVEIGVDGEGRLDMAALAAAADERTALISIIWANNETGVISPVEEISAFAAERDIPLHVDAVQTAGKLPVSLRKSAGIRFASFSAHKFHGIKGSGFLYVRRGTRFVPLLTGGHQERGRRAGTENLPGIAAMGAAAQAVCGEAGLLAASTRGAGLRDRLEGLLCEFIPGTVVNGTGAHRVWNTSSIALPIARSLGGARALLPLLDQAGLCVSAGAACTTGSPEPSHVLRAMGFSPALGAEADLRARNTLRFSLSRGTTIAEIDEAAHVVRRCFHGLSAASGARA